MPACPEKESNPDITVTSETDKLRKWGKNAYILKSNSQNQGKVVTKTIQDLNLTIGSHFYHIVQGTTQQKIATGDSEIIFMKNNKILRTQNRQHTQNRQYNCAQHFNQNILLYKQ